MAGLGVIGQKVTKQRDQVYQKAAGRAEGALGSIKTVAAFSGQVGISSVFLSLFYIRGIVCRRRNMLLIRNFLSLLKHTILETVS